VSVLVIEDEVSAASIVEVLAATVHIDQDRLGASFLARYEP
jgi:hypothetical protein